MGSDGFEFVEYAAPDPAALGCVFEQLGFTAVARHRSKDVTLYRQGDINYVLNAEPDSFAQSFARVHGPSICAMAFRVRDAAGAYQRAQELAYVPQRPVWPPGMSVRGYITLGRSPHLGYFAGESQQDAAVVTHADA